MEEGSTLSPGNWLSPQVSNAYLLHQVFFSSQILLLTRPTGNGGTASMDKVKNVNIGVSDFPSLVEFAQKNDINLVVPGPEVPLVEGIETHFRKGNLFLSSISLTCSWHTLLRANREGCQNGRIKGILQRLYVPTSYTDCPVTCLQAFVGHR